VRKEEEKELEEQQGKKEALYFKEGKSTIYIY